ncbi:MAG: HlyD family type I secretion periplasmic adaptor subunit [Caldimonas sp.]
MNTTSAAAPPRHPLTELLGRYAAVFRAAWVSRHELAGPKRLTDEQAFLPAALSLQETPAHPAPRRVALVLCVLFVIAIVWSILGEVDIVAIAPGRIVVSERTKTLQPLEAGIVKRVLVQDGDFVVAGQVLVELDSTNASADSASVKEQLGAAWSEELRTAALLSALGSSRPPSLALPRGAAWSEGDLPDREDVSAQLLSEWRDITAKLSKLGSEHDRREAEIATVRELVAKLDATLPIAQQREADFKSLTAQGFMSSHAVQDRTRDRIEQERDLAMQKARLLEAKAALMEAQSARLAYLAETQRLLSERHAGAQLKRQQLVQEHSKAEQRSRLTQLTAPVAGKVQQVAVHTEGGVVTPAQVLMIIVPRDSKMTAEVALDNKDIGFVNVGDTAQIKLETFPYTKYGTVESTISSVTGDAVNDEKKGAVFPATLTLARSSIDVDGKTINLSPGMNVTAEVKTGRRRVIEYLLSPVERSFRESLGER